MESDNSDLVTFILIRSLIMILSMLYRRGFVLAACFRPSLYRLILRCQTGYVHAYIIVSNFIPKFSPEFSSFVAY